MIIDDKLISFFNSGYIETSCGHWIWIRANNHGTDCTGYGLFIYKGIRVVAHRISYIIHKENIPSHLHVCHTCDIPQCVNPEHLFLGTDKDNMIDASKKGRLLRNDTVRKRMSKVKQGMCNPYRKLTNEQVLEIRKSKSPLAELSNKYNVSQATISGIRRNNSWKHLK